MKDLLAATFSILSIIFLYMGFDKIFNYENSELSDIKKNVYVGGDAYNYIINSNLSTSYFVLATFFGLVAVGIMIIKSIEKLKQIN
ncbi:MAG TPA: hypothetical protein PKD18_14475 [Saprospiraceae bacterium]|nr:hypothetical protein [Saprospiraceae bacterium]